MVKLNNFVNVNIDRNVQLSLSGSRGEVFLFGASVDKTLVGSDSTFTNFYDKDAKEVTLNDNDKLYAAYFFRNGGYKLTLKTDKIPTTDSGFMALPIDNVILATEETDVNLDTLKDTLESLTGVYQKIFVTRTEKVDSTTDSTTIPSSNFIACIYSKNKGSEMMIAGYLSQIKMYQNNSPVDYDFTLVNFPTDKNEDLSNDITISADNLINYKYNFTMKIGDNYYNIGGNTTNGKDLVEQFGLIVMEQDLTTEIFKTLSSKISGQKGLSAIRTTIAETLTKFVDSGFLITNQIWTDNDLVLNNKVKPGNEEVVISKNTPISNGYYIHMFKISSDLRQVYCAIVVATNKGIRYIVVDGKAI